mmetsp:Transcript_16698/g.19058  ORF Transcript_16698/g.19058 Transcript_16698/m.19058 type:complete len:109 (+) Transcript_16698:394-720(+)
MVASHISLQSSPMTYRIPASTYQKGELDTNINLLPLFLRDKSISFKWGVGSKYFFWIIGNNSMEITTDMRPPNSIQYIHNSILWTKWYIILMKELNNISNQTTFSHRK